MAARNQQQIREQLRKLGCLKGLDEGTLSAVANNVRLEHYKPGEILFWEDAPCAGLFIVESGWLKAVKISIEGREQVIRFFRPGEMFNEVALFAGGKNLVSVESLEESSVWMIPADQISLLIKNYPLFSQVLLENLAKRVQHLLSRIEDLSFRKVEARLARALLENAQENIATRRRWSTQSEMAAYMGTVPDVLHRVLKRLADEKVIHVERTQITILDEERLREVAMLLE
jgi:CRP/FNR family transcriptional regulator